jgi:hypothetical protein
MQKVLERQETEVKPPPGGSVVSWDAHPGACRIGANTVVGTADGNRVVVGAAAVVVVVTRVVGGDRRAAVGAEAVDAQPAASSADAAKQMSGAFRFRVTDSPSSGSGLARWIPGGFPPWAGARRLAEP